MPFLWTRSARDFVPAVALVALACNGRAASNQPAPFPDPASLDARNAKVEVVDYQGRKSVRVTALSHDDGPAIAIMRGTDFQDGTIETDLAVKITMPPGVRMPGFAGMAFRMKADGSEYENVYLRPKNALADDQAMRNHAIQYCAEPDYGWYRLRREWPYAYETYVDIKPETWIHLRIEVAGRSARIFLNGSPQPILVVDGLKGANLHGGVALWGYAGEEAYFSDVRITPLPPVAVKNGSDAAGTWTVRYSSDMGRFEGSMKLTRDGDKVSGTWSGGLGDGKPITGTWRDGHIELSFTGDWPNDGREGAPGPVPAFLEGWIDDASAKGRMRVQGRADGRWEAQRQAQ